MVKLLGNARVSLLAALVALAGAGLPGLANAGLTGKHVTVAIGSAAVDTFQIDETVTVLVQDPEVELASLGQIFMVDLTDTGLRLEVVNTPGGLALPSMYFAGVLFSAFEGNTVNGLTGGSTNIVGFGSNSSNGQSRVLAPPALTGLVAFNFEGLSLRDGDFVEVSLNLSQVPEPMSFALMLLGLGLLTYRLRRQH